jgi:hypothetical protein
MPKPSVVELHWPTGGVSKRTGHQQEAPYFAPDALNCRTYDVIQGRERGGSRPGLTKAYYTQLGSGNPVRLLSSVAVVSSDDYTFLEDDFKSSTLGSAWTTATWIGTAPSVTDDFSSIAYNVDTGVTHSAISNFDSASTYEIGLYIAPYAGSHNGSYKIFGRMGAGLDATVNGFVATLTMTDAVGTYSGTLVTYNASVATTYNFSGGATGQPDAGWFRASVNGTTVACTWLGNSLTSQTPTFGGSAGHNWGFGANCTVSGGICLIDTVRMAYKTTNKAQNVRRPLVASANGSVYYESRIGTLATLGGSLTLASDRQLQAAERAQKLYIADNSNPAVTGTTGVTNGAGTLLDDAAVTDWTALGLNVNDYVASLISGSGVTAGTYAFNNIHATNGLTLTSSAGASASAIVYRVERGPKVLDLIAGTLTALTATAGIVPVGCPLVARYRDRLVLAGAPVAPHVWYMSRQGTFTDFDYAAASTDGGRAVAGTSADAGTIGEPITALICHSDDYMIFGCLNSMWILRGDPAYQGQIDNLSRNVGVVDKQAWCRGPGGEVYVLSRDGIYMIPPGGQGGPQPISRDVLPGEMLDIDRTNYTVTLTYDFRARGVNIFITSNDAKQCKSYFFDLRTKAFWPETYPNSYQATAAHELISDSAVNSGVILGCRDGYLRRFYDGMETDDGTSITNYAVYGPIRLGNSDYLEGRCDELIAVTATNSGTVTGTVRVGETHEAAEASSAFYTATLSTAGINYKHRPRARGASCYIRLAGSGSRCWAIERLALKIARTGGQRLA